MGVYYPYFRGKQNELITIRENAQLISSSGFIPIVEPVKSSLAGLTKAINTIVEAQGKIVIVVNPFHGEHSNADGLIYSYLEAEFDHYENIYAGILLTEQHSVDDALQFFNQIEK